MFKLSICFSTINCLLTDFQIFYNNLNLYFYISVFSDPDTQPLAEQHLVCQAREQQLLAEQGQNQQNVQSISVYLPGQAFNIPHPSVCNAFITCGKGEAFLPCIYCGAGLIFQDNSTTV